MLMAGRRGISSVDSKTTSLIESMGDNEILAEYLIFVSLKRRIENLLLEYRADLGAFYLLGNDLEAIDMIRTQRTVLTDLMLSQRRQKNCEVVGVLTLPSTEEDIAILQAFGESSSECLLTTQ